MKRQVFTLHCGVGPMMRAREAVGAVPGVIAAEPIPGRCALQVWRSDEVPEAALREIVRRFEQAGP